MTLICFRFLILQWSMWAILLWLLVFLLFCFSLETVLGISVNCYNVFFHQFINRVVRRQVTVLKYLRVEKPPFFHAKVSDISRISLSRVYIRPVVLFLTFQIRGANESVVVSSFSGWTVRRLGLHQRTLSWTCHCNQVFPVPSLWLTIIPSFGSSWSCQFC